MFSSRYKFADFVLDSRERTLCKGGETLKLKNRTFQVLRMFVENAGKLITKKEFFESIWENSFVEENNLSVAVAEIRRVLGQTRENRFIQTVPKKGYRFVAEVETVEDLTVEDETDFAEVEQTNEQTLVADELEIGKIETLAEAKKGFFAVAASRKYMAVILAVVVVFAIGWLWRQNSLSAKKSSEPFRSIAVLPFAADSKTPSNQIFTEKLTQELIYNLGRITDTRVSSYESIAVYNSPEVNANKAGNDLQVDAVVTGQISFDEAAVYSQKSLYIDKSNAATLYNLSEIYEQKGNIKEAVELWKEAMVIEAAARHYIADIEKSYQTDGHQGFVRAKTNWLEDLIEKDYVYPTDLAKFYAVFGDKDKAINWIEKGIEARVPDILSIKYAPAFDNLKNDEHYQAILTKMNFPN